MANLLFANKLRYKFFLCMHDQYQYQINFVETLCEIYSISNNDEDFGRVYKRRSLKVNIKNVDRLKTSTK